MQHVADTGHSFHEEESIILDTDDNLEDNSNERKCIHQSPPSIGDQTELTVTTCLHPCKAAIASRATK